jgi:single-strand DNA-binding protein
MGKDREGVNRVILAGRVVTEPKWHKAGKNHWLHFTLLTEETIRGVKETFIHEERHHICVYGQNTSMDNFQVKKNDVIFVQGRLSTHNFLDGDGVKRYKTEIVASIIERIST